MSVKYRKMNDGDYSFGRGLQDFYTNEAAVSQAIKTRLLLLQGEWWEKTELGLPLFQNILGLPGTPENIRAIDLLVRNEILGTPGVQNIVSFQSAYEDRTYSLLTTVATIYGDAQVDIIF